MKIENEFNKLLEIISSLENMGFYHEDETNLIYNTLNEYMLENFSEYVEPLNEFNNDKELQEEYEDFEDYCLSNYGPIYYDTFFNLDEEDQKKIIDIIPRIMKIISSSDTYLKEEDIINSL